MLAERLAAHPAVAAVHYPGLPDDPGHDRAARLMDGFGAMLAFEVAGGAEAAQAVAERVRVIVHATSLGGVETLIERRARYQYEATPRRCCGSASASRTSRTSGATSSARCLRLDEVAPLQQRGRHAETEPHPAQHHQHRDAGARAGRPVVDR